MVVILLLTPPYTQTEACDGGAASNDSSTSTGDTAIPAYTFQIPQQQQQKQQQSKFEYYYFPYSSQYRSSNAYTTASNSLCSCHCCLQQKAQVQTAALLPKSQSPNESNIGWNGSSAGGLRTASDKSFFGAKDQWPNAAGHNKQATYAQQPQTRPQAPHYRTRQQQVDNGRFYSSNPTTNYSRAMPQRFQIYITNNTNNNQYNNKNTCTNTSDFVRHVTRVNFYDVDTSQVEFESKENHDDNNEQQLDTEAITKEGM